jgi:hypothetical protein
LEKGLEEIPSIPDKSFVAQMVEGDAKERMLMKGNIVENIQ